MKEYKLVTGILKLQEAAKEGWVFVDLINPHEWLVEKVEEPKDITTTSGDKKLSKVVLPKVEAKHKPNKVTWNKNK